MTEYIRTFVVIGLYLSCLGILLIWPCRFGLHLYDLEGRCVECGKRKKEATRG